MFLLLSVVLLTVFYYFYYYLCAKCKLRVGNAIEVGRPKLTSDWLPTSAAFMSRLTKNPNFRHMQNFARAKYLVWVTKYNSNLYDRPSCGHTTLNQH